MKKSIAQMFELTSFMLMMIACTPEHPETTIVVVEAGSAIVAAEEESDDTAGEGGADENAETAPVGPCVQINDISLQQNTYIVAYETFNYTESIPGMHIHFFFNSVAPEAAGVGGGGQWYVWGGPRPFNGYTSNDRGSASQICALVANIDHSIILNTGTCYDLPGSPAG